MTTSFNNILGVLFSAATYMMFVVVSSAKAQPAKQAVSCFDPGIQFEILTAVTGTTTQSSARSTTRCQEWTIPKDVISSIIKDSKLIAGEQWHYDFNVLPCIVSGQLTQNGQTYRYELNSGSWLYVYCDKQAIILGYYKSDYKKYFLSPGLEGN